MCTSTNGSLEKVRRLFPPCRVSSLLPETIGITWFEVFTGENFEAIDDDSSTRVELTFDVERFFLRMIIGSTIDAPQLRVIDVVHSILLVKFLLRGKNNFEMLKEKARRTDLIIQMDQRTRLHRVIFEKFLH